jgi:hypothetical protein
MGESGQRCLFRTRPPYAVPNGGYRNIYVARKLKAEGVKAGVADLCLPAARRGYHGLYLEMKSEEGVATKEQKAFFAECWKRAIARS